MPTATKRGVSDVERAKVKERSRGLCELFHVLPSPGNQLVHPTGKDHPGHQGIGGASEDAECNQAKVVLWGCQVCQDLTHSRYTMARIDLDANELEIVDWDNCRVPHEQIFFHQRRWWLEALRDYPDLTQAIVEWNVRGLRVAELLARFAPEKGKPRLQYVCEELAQASAGLDLESMTPAQDFERFFSFLGMTRTRGNELRKIGQWVVKEKLGDIVMGVDLDALDALRGLPDEEQAELLGLWERPSDFWDGVDRIRSGKCRRSWLIDRPGDELAPVKSAERPEIADDETLIRGRIVAGVGVAAKGDDDGDDAPTG